jgi:RND superfamily putative drug exporter
MGRWSAAHWKTATIGWLALVVVAFGIGGALGTKQIDPNTQGPGESGRMDRILDAGFKQPAGESVLVQSDTLRTSDPAFRAAVADVVTGVSEIDVVQNVQSPFARGNSGQIAKNGHAVLVQFEIPGDYTEAMEKVVPVVDKVAEVQKAHPQLFVGEFGDASAPAGAGEAAGKDLEKAGMLSLPITLIILAVTFGALVAAGIPLLLGLTAVFATFGLLALPSQVLPMAMEVPSIVLLIGLAVGVDYSMFYVRRVREERAAGRSTTAAIEAAAATSGRSVLISGLTVMAAMAGMFLTGDKAFASFGVATILVVAIAVLGSLTVLPALLAKLGDRVDRGRIPFLGRRKTGPSRFWDAVVNRVLARPALSAALSAGLLLLLAAPALGLHMARPGPDTYPQSIPMVKAYTEMQQAFPGTALPANVVVKAPNVNAPAVREAIDRLEQQALASGRMQEPITIDVNRAGTVANITIPIAGTGTDEASSAALETLREDLIPATVGKLPNTDAGVTGLAAQWKDQTDELKSNLPPVVAFVLVLAFGLMLVAFRSIVVAAKAVVLNLLSVAAAYGVLVLVFQHGFGKGLLGFGSTAGIDPVVPLLLFVILFGLSMDYHVLVLGRIRELFNRGASMDEAVSEGIKSTAGVVTSAAVVMVAVFSVFATLSMLMFKQFGVGLAVAILIDATIVRAVLLPATMKLLGEWNWYLPRWLQWLPGGDSNPYDVGPEPGPAPSVAAVAAPAPRSRTFTTSRIVALALIVIAAGGLAYLHFGTGESRVSVPAGAEAGDLILDDCSYGTEKGSYDADCGTLVVPENRADAGSRLIALPVTRIHARSAHPAEPIFRLQGGPGVTNMSFTQASRYADDHDVVLVGYRGIDGSVRLDCPEVESALARSTDFLAAKSFRAQNDAFRACADRLTDDGIDLAGYGVVGQVEDLEAARKALGYERIDLLSESAGTRTAMIYAWRHPQRVHRSVMIAVNPPGHFLWDAKTTDAQIARYARLCAADASCSKRTDDLAATMAKTAADMPDRFWGLPVEKSNVLNASMFGLFETTQESAPLTGPMTLDAWLSAAHGDASGLWLQSFAARLFFPKAFVWGQYAAFGRADAAAAREHFAAGRLKPETNLADAATSFVWGGGELVDAWPVQPNENEYARVRPSNVPTLLVGGELDLSTPPQNATKELLPYLSNGHQVVLPGFGHSTSFFTQQREAGSRLVNTYFDTGKVDTSLYEPQKVDFTPEVTQTALGKGIAAAIFGLAGLTVVSLLWMAVRVLLRGRYGRKASATLRTVYPVVLGVGGWFLGLIVATTTMPGVALDDELLVTLSIGVPVALGVYLGWLDRSASTKAAGLLAAVAGALAGTWLGFHAAADLLALLTAVVGATAGANLMLVAVDVIGARERRRVEPVAVAPVPAS